MITNNLMLEYLINESLIEIILNFEIKLNKGKENKNKKQNIKN